MNKTISKRSLRNKSEFSIYFLRRHRTLKQSTACKVHQKNPVGYSYCITYINIDVQALFTSFTVLIFHWYLQPLE